MKIQNILISIAVVLSLVISFMAFDKTNVVVQTPQQQSFGAVASPDIMSPYISYGGVAHYVAKTENLIQASTTVCTLQSPAATSTLEFGSIRFRVSSTTASVTSMYKSATPYTSTTLIGAGALAANAQGTLVASTTSTGAIVDGTNVFGPSTWLVFVMSGGTGTFSPTGVCQAGWRTI